jgi:hypothetical protein
MPRRPPASQPWAINDVGAARLQPARLGDCRCRPHHAAPGRFDASQQGRLRKPEMETHDLGLTCPPPHKWRRRTGESPTDLPQARDEPVAGVAAIEQRNRSNNVSRVCAEIRVRPAALHFPLRPLGARVGFAGPGLKPSSACRRRARSPQSSFDQLGHGVLKARCASRFFKNCA